MKKFSPAFVFLIVSFFLVLFSCKKINEATDLGGNLIPAVDNVSTFEVSLNAITKNLITTDSAKVRYTDQVALGDVNDPEFGQVHANFCFNLSAPAYGSYPFQPRRDTLHTIDSVVLSLRYAGGYGDTIGNGIQTVNVFEIPYSGPGTGLRADTVYRYIDPASDFTGSQVGSKTFSIASLHDSVPVMNPGDTFQVANVLRIKLDNAIGSKLANMALDSAIGGYYNDSIFRTQFNGLAIKSANSGNALSYFNLSDTATKLIVYYRYQVNGHDTTGIVQYHHTVNGQSNYVNVQKGGNWAASINNSSADKVYIQSSPSGSYASIVIPNLSSFGNKVIHRAEIIATKVPSANDNIFTPPFRLLLDRISNNADSSYLFEKDLLLGSDGSVGYINFGGTISNNLYRFNITRYVQGIVTKNDRNDTLRLWAPLRAWEYSKNLGYYLQNLPVNSRVAEGRVVLGGGTYSDSTSRLRLRIVYSNQ
ncbi:MAG: DUF4270 family protein [Flavisolibacter sp.]